MFKEGSKFDFYRGKIIQTKQDQGRYAEKSIRSLVSSKKKFTWEKTVAWRGKKLQRMSKEVEGVCLFFIHFYEKNLSALQRLNQQKREWISYALNEKSNEKY